MKIPALIFWHHLGLGDHFICNALVHELLQVADTIWLPCKNLNLTTVCELYSDHPRVRVFGVHTTDFDDEIRLLCQTSIRYAIPLLKIGSFTGDFAAEFYKQLDIPIERRWTGFKMPRDRDRANLLYKELIKDTKYALIHRTASVGTFEISVKTELPIYTVTKLSESLLDWSTIIENAAEIHCIDSSFIHLVDSLDVTKVKLYYYDVGRGSVLRLSNGWQVIQENQ